MRCSVDDRAKSHGSCYRSSVKITVIDAGDIRILCVRLVGGPVFPSLPMPHPTIPINGLGPAAGSVDARSCRRAVNIGLRRSTRYTWQ